MDLGTVLSPSAALSSSGDFATDTFNDPWDFSNPKTHVGLDSRAGCTEHCDPRHGRAAVDWPTMR